MKVTSEVVFKFPVGFAPETEMLLRKLYLEDPSKDFGVFMVGTQGFLIKYNKHISEGIEQMQEQMHDKEAVMKFAWDGIIAKSDIAMQLRNFGDLLAAKNRQVSTSPAPQA